MSKLLNLSLKRLILYAAVVLACSVPAYYVVITWLWQYEMKEHNIVLSTEAAKHDSYLIIIAVTGMTAVFFILMLGGFVLMNRWISRRLWQPFYKSLEQIKSFNLSDQQPISFEQTAVTEFAELNQGLDKLISGNLAAYKQQKEFADNASHELQTPLAIIQSKLELLLQSESLTALQYETIEETLQALARVRRINKNLLLLTKIENSQYMDTERINLSNLLNDIIAPLHVFSNAKGLTWETDIQQGIEVKGNRILMEILLNNLLTNAVRHSAAGTSIGVKLSGKNLLVSNSGPASLKKDLLFRRFAGVSSETPGTGLGLALASQICQRYGWHLSYAFIDGSHSFHCTFI